MQGPRIHEPTRLREGRLVVGVERHQSTVSLTVPTGADVTRAWLAERGLASELSDPGRTALEIARRLHGVFGLRLALGPERLQLLETGTRKHHLPAQRVHRAIRDDTGEPYAGGLARLTGLGVLRAGLLLQCPRCHRNNFVPPNDLADEMRCERCLERFAFPHHDPSRTWAYRPVGPFAVEGYAAGAYSALLAVHTLVDGSTYAATWTPSVEVDGVGEVDFAMWRARRMRFVRRELPELILGEAKTFDQFKQVDVDRLLRMRARIGEGWLCFATLRETLEPEERALLQRAVDTVATPGAPAPLIVLTALEMWSRDLAGDLQARLTETGQDVSAIRASPSADQLAWATQQLHLS
jgi:hypothetical protein